MPPRTNARPRCFDGGVLVASDEWLPTDPRDWNWSPAYPVIGCSSLVCSACGKVVRNFPHRELARGETPSAATLFALVDWEHAPELMPSSGRVYACECAMQQEFATHALEPREDQGVQQLTLPWRCATHEPMALPGDLDGVHVDAKTTDFDVLVTEALALRKPATRPWTTVDERRYPAFWLARLYVLADAVDERTQIGLAAGRALGHDDVLVRRGALNFYLFHPKAPGAEELAVLLATERERFDGVVDPDEPRRELGFYLRIAVMERLELRDANGYLSDLAAYDAVRADLLAGHGTTAFLLRLVRADPDWLVANAVAIIRASPRLLPMMVYAFDDLDVGARVVTAIIAEGAATSAEVTQALTAPLNGIREPKRSALLRAVELAAP